MLIRYRRCPQFITLPPAILQSPNTRQHRSYWTGGLLALACWCPLVPAHALSQRPVDQPSVIILRPIVPGGLEQPVFVTHAGDRSGRLFIVEQPGRIRILRDGRLLDQAFLDISSRVKFGGERGLLGLAFHPHYAENKRYVLNYTRAGDGATVVSEWHASSQPNRSEVGEKILLVIPQPYSNHNGGMIAFGRDGYLYIGMGDGGSGGDPQNRAQNLQDLLGKFLRIDVDREDPYAIPESNPLSGPRGRPEIYAWGFRNPWRFSFDRKTGDLWAGDVGQNSWEEIDRVELGKNYGWRIMEGNHCFSPASACSRQGLELPVAEYANARPHCAVTGGYVYRGTRVPNLEGTYIFADYCSGEIMAWQEGQIRTLLASGLRISALGEDEAGELYVVDHGGSIQQIVPRNIR